MEVVEDFHVEIPGSPMPNRCLVDQATLVLRKSGMYDRIVPVTYYTPYTSIKQLLLL